MFKKVAVLCSLLLAFGSVANAAVVWAGGNGVWSDTTKWLDGTGAHVNRVPVATESADIGGTATVTIDTAAVCNLLRLAPGASDDVALVLNSDAYSLTIAGTSAEVFSVGKSGKGVVNQSAGVVTVSSTNATKGEVRVTTGSLGSAYNLSGGILDAGVIRKNNQADSGQGLYSTGGTVVVRNGLYRIGEPNSEAPGENKFMVWVTGSLIAPGGVDTVGVFNVGLSNYEEQIQTTDSAIVEIDLASDASYDKMRGSNTATLNDGTLKLKALGGYVPALYTTFDVWKVDLKSGKAGTGTFDQILDNLPGYFVASGVVNGVPLGWLDLDGDPNGRTETLRIMYIPEPATLSLVTLGGLAALIRRRGRK